MRPLFLDIAGQPADLPATVKGLVKFTQARASLGDVAARVGEYSFPLTLPPTRGNARIFGVDKLHPQGVGKFGPYTDYPYELRVGGQVFAGTFRLTALKNGYTGTLIGDGLSWALLLGNTKLTDLLFPPVDYDGSQLAAVQAMDCNASDIQFPLVAFGNFFAPPTTRTAADGTTEEVPAPPSAVLSYPLAVDDYPPSVYYGNVLRQIFRSIGWELRGRELDAEAWRSVVVTPAGADVASAWPWGRLLQARQAGSASCFSYYESGPLDPYANSWGGFWSLQDGEVFFLPLACPLTNSPTRALDAGWASYTAPRNGVYRFRWKATLSGGHQVWRKGLGYQLLEPYFQPVGLGLVLRRGGQDYTDAEGGLCTKFAPGSPTPPDYVTGQDRVLTPHRLDTGGQGLAIGTSFSEETGDVYLEAGDVVQLATFARRRQLTGAGNNILTRSEFVADFTGVEFACVSYTDDQGVNKTQLQPADFLPPLSCTEVVRDFLTRTDSFLVADAGQRVATLFGRGELSRAGGAPLDLSELCDSRAVEYQPAAGAGVGSYVFSPAALSDDPLVSESADVVTARVGPGAATKAVGSVFAVAGFRSYYSPSGPLPLPCLSTADILKQNCSEMEWDFAAQPPRLLRYQGTDATRRVPFMLGTVPLGLSTWDGPLAWDGAAGAVGTYYASTIRRAVNGHLARVQVPLTPALYQQLTPGRRVHLHGAPYTVETSQNFDPSDEAALTQLDLSREVL
jgi:hypothetical protein